MNIFFKFWMSTSLLLPGEIIEDYSMCNRNTKEKLWGGHEKFFELEKMIDHVDVAAFRKEVRNF